MRVSREPGLGSCERMRLASVSCLSASTMPVRLPQLTKESP